MKILVADDHPVNRNMMKMLLGALGHTVDVVDDGAQACAATEAEVYDLVLMDLHMPVMDGLEAISIIGSRQRPPPRLVVVTADHTVDSRAQCFASGVQTKPIDLAKLASIIALTIEKADLAQAV